MKKNQEDVLRILKKINSITEFDFYKGLYDRAPIERLAVMKISGQCLDDSLDIIAEDITDLALLNFLPTIIHGWGASLTERLKNNKIPTRKINEDRYTDMTVMNYVLEIARENIEKLKTSIEQRGGKAKILWPTEDPIIIAQDKKDKRYGEHNGDIVRINKGPIIEALYNGEIPLVSPIGISEDGKKLYNLNSASSSAQLVLELDPLKFIMLNETKGIYGADKTIISEIILNRDYETLKRTGIVYGGALKNVDEAALSLNLRTDGEDKSVQITGPDKDSKINNLLLELYSQKGAGTYIRKGFDIVAEPIEFWNKEKLIELIEKTFKRKLKKDFFTECCKDVHVERRYKGAAIVIPKETGPEEIKEIADYLDIIAVDCEYKGKGIGTDLLDSIFKYQDVGKKGLFWRSSSSRPINDWYYHISDGHQRYTGVDGKEYNAFWIGLDNDKKQKALEFLENRQPNFED
jgi:acetylglutamate kinase